MKVETSGLPFTGGTIEGVGDSDNGTGDGDGEGLAVNLRSPVSELLELSLSSGIVDDDDILNGQ